MKKLYIIILSLLAVLIGGYLFTRYALLKTDLFKPDYSNAQNLLDLRPRIVAKLQQLVHDGSDGLYRLEVDSFDIDISDGTLDFTDAVLKYDTVKLRYLDSIKKAPDDLYNIHFNALHIDGFGIADMLDNNEISIKGIILDHPKMHVFSTERPYNAVIRRQKDSLSLYKKIMGSLTHLSVEKIIVKDGTFQNTYNNRSIAPASFYGVSVEMNNLLIDKTTEFDAKRILFAKKLKITSKNYLYRTADSLYNLKCGSVIYTSSDRRLTAYNVQAEPRLSEKAFTATQEYQNERYDVKLQKIVLSDVDWWAFLNYKKLTAKELIIPGGKVSIYLNRSLPVNPTPDGDNFPHQLFMKMGLPVDIKKLVVKKLNIEYKEFNPSTGKAGTVYIDSVNVTGNNISNTRFSGNSRYLRLDCEAILMHKFPVKLSLSFDKQKTNTGEFTADVLIGLIDDKEALNQVAQPLGGFLVKKGTLQKAEAKIMGNNIEAKADVLVLYNDLAIQPLKKDSDNPGRLKKKFFTGIIANLFVIKHSNPAGNNPPRLASINYKRLPHASFLNLVWKALLTGILETVGIPEKFAQQSP